LEGNVTPVAARAYILLATGLSYLGLAKACLDRWRVRGLYVRRLSRRLDFAYALGVFLLLLLPALAESDAERRPYQVTKLLFTVSPLFALGLALLFQRFPSGRRGREAAAAAASKLGVRVAAAFAGVVVIALMVVGTARMTAAEGHAAPQPRSLAHVLLSRDMQTLQRELPRLSPGPLICAYRDPFRGYQSAWISYFARQDSVWLADPLLNMNHNLDIGEAKRIADLRTAPPKALVLTRRAGDFRSVAAGDLELIWSGESFALWRSPGGAWAVPLAWENPNGLQEQTGTKFFWIGGKPTSLEVVALCPGEVTLGAVFTPGPSLAATRTRRVRVCAGAGFCTEFVTQGGAEEIAVPITSGRTIITFEALDRPDAIAKAGKEPSPRLVGAGEWSFRFRPCSAWADDPLSEKTEKHETGRR
jgi:hypothetical protein